MRLHLGCCLLVALVATLLENGPASAVRAQPPVGQNSAWQPYREVQPLAIPLAQPIAVTPAVPADAVSDAQLDQLRTAWNYQPQPGAYCAAPGMPPGTVCDGPLVYPQDAVYFDSAEAWQWTVLPEGLIYRSYWAGAKEPRISGAFFRELNNKDSLLDVALGGRVGILRYGSTSASEPLGWQLDLEGAAFPRLNLDENWDLESVDFRFGIPLTYGEGCWQWKFSYYHLSSHLGDEKALREGILGSRINFSRDVLLSGVSFVPRPAWRWYAEVGWAFYSDGGSDPWEFQFGLDYAQPGPTGQRGTPFAAINGHLRQEVDFGGNLAAQAGWLWRGETGHVMRTGLHYFNGKSSQFEFFNEFEQQLGVGLWYDY